MSSKIGGEDLIQPVILSGGSGTRLWPLSRAAYPKQFQALAATQSLLQETALRMARNGFASPTVICNQEHRFLVAEQLREAEVSPRTIILEPVGRNTAPAAAVAADYLSSDGSDPLILLLASDHVVGQPDELAKAVQKAVGPARSGAMVALGVEPKTPETGYGYILRGEPIDGSEGAFEIGRFVEKPDLETAKSYLEAGGYYWNASIFLFSARRYLEELEQLRPEMAAHCRTSVTRGEADLGFLRLHEESFEMIHSESIDYAVMEPTGRSAVVPVDMGWSDVGSWNALWEIGEKDNAGNVMLGDVQGAGLSNSYLRSEGPMLAAIGLDNVVIVATGDAVLAVARDQTDAIKELVEGMERTGWPEHSSHPKTYRPWGWYQSLETGEGFQVKQISLKPEASISLQRHSRRAEHWVVVAGTATVTRDEEILELQVNQSTFIPLGMIHRLQNFGEAELRIIEVQSGNYLGEDDIERFEDIYGRDQEGS